MINSVTDRILLSLSMRNLAVSCCRQLLLSIDDALMWQSRTVKMRFANISVDPLFRGAHSLLRHNTSVISVVWSQLTADEAVQLYANDAECYLFSPVRLHRITASHSSHSQVECTSIDVALTLATRISWLIHVDPEGVYLQ